MKNEALGHPVSDDEDGSTHRTAANTTSSLHCHSVTGFVAIRKSVHSKKRCNGRNVSKIIMKKHEKHKKRASEVEDHRAKIAGGGRRPQSDEAGRKLCETEVDPVEVNSTRVRKVILLGFFLELCFVHSVPMWLQLNKLIYVLKLVSFSSLRSNVLVSPRNTKPTKLQCRAIDVELSLFSSQMI